MLAIYIYLYNRAKRLYRYNSRIEFANIKSIEYKKEDLWIFSIDSNSFNGRNVIVVPKEIKGFAQVEFIIKQQLK